MQRSGGFSYLGLLGLLALIGAGLAALGPLWSTAMQRERERELRFRGEEIARAIAAYRDAIQPAQWPRNLDELLQDERGGTSRHHLRRRYLDPFTGAADWRLLPATGEVTGGATGTQGFAGVSSRSTQTRLLRSTDDADPRDDGAAPRVSDWRFLAPGPAAAPPIPADPSQSPSP